MKYLYSSSKEFKKEILEHPEIPWDWNILSFHHLTTTDFIEEIISTRTIIQFNWTLMSQNPNITFSFVLTYLDKPWNWMKLSSHSNIRMKDIEEFPELPWDYKGISFNKNLTREFFEKHLHENWNWMAISEKEFLTFQFIEEHSYLPWCWKTILSNPNISWEMIISKKNIPWDYSRIIIKVHQTCEEREESFKRTTKRTNIFKEDLIRVTGQPEYFFRYCLDEQEKKELGFDETFLQSLKKPNFRI